MTNSLWNNAYQYFSAQGAIYLKFRSLDYEQQLASLSSDEEQGDASPLPEPMVNLTDLHDELVGNLQTLMANISDLVGEEQSRYIIDALAFYCDETVLTQHFVEIQISQETLEHQSRTTALQKLSAFWPKLQVTFCQCQDGGERFFTNLDTLLTHPTTYRFALEMYYFCLKQGFAGRFMQEVDRLEYYQAQCFKALSPLAENRLAQSSPLLSKAKNEPRLGEHDASSV
jgi:type IV/VI secretion system ImpK/VasF family protein